MCCSSLQKEIKHKNAIDTAELVQVYIIFITGIEEIGFL